MTLNLDKNKDALVEAWKEVLDEKNPIDWALFGYDGQTYDLNLVSKGDGGLDEMVEDFNSGKIQYALCRVKIKDKNVEKILLINWQGEGAPLARKGMCANHLGTIKSFFKGVHVSMNARTDEDVEPDLIVDYASKAIFGEGIKMSSSIEQEIGPVGTCYKRVNPKEEINSKAKDDFWRKQEQEEERRKVEEQTRLRKFSQDEVKLLRKESQDYFDKEEQDAIHSSIIKSTPSPKPVVSTNGNGLFFNSNGNSNNTSYSSTSPIPPKECAAATAAALKASTPMKNHNSDLVRQRVKSFDGGPAPPVFPSNGSKSNGTSSNLKTPGIPGGIRSPSPTKPTVNGSNGSEATSPGTNNTVTSESLSVLKRRQLFEGSQPSNGVQPGRRNPAEEIRLAQEEQKKQMEAEGRKAKKEKEELEERKRKKEAEELEVRKRKEEQEELEGRKAKKEQVELEERRREKEQQDRRKEQEELEVRKRKQEQEELEERKRKKELQELEERKREKELEEIRKRQKEQEELEQRKRAIIPEVVPKEEEEERVVSPVVHFQSDLIAQPIPAPEGFQNSFEEPTDSHRSYKTQGPPPDIQLQMNTSHATPAIIEDHSVRSGQAAYSSDLPSSPSPTRTGRTSTSPKPQDDDFGDTVTIEITPQMGLCARALYDYQAGDDTEITFDPGEIITNIERIDEGWWEGLGPQGQYGLFPANYVELLN